MREEKQPQSDNHLIEPLTPREQDVLFLLAQHLRYQDIAEQLTLAISSVKWFAQQIYSKLGVDNRRDAIQRAQEFGLLVREPAAPISPTAEGESFPSGLVTFLFTDIEGSTPLWEQMPEAMQAAVAQHHALLRQTIEAYGGQVFQVIGDAFQAAFQLASDGLRAALAAQRALRDAKWGPTGPLKVRMGLHTGPAERDPNNDAPYQVSHTLNRAARVMSAGYGGQILLTVETASLVDHELPAGVLLKSLGEHRLKGMSSPEMIYQALAPDLPQEFPALATAVTRPNNLPAQLTSFIGREKEIAAVSDLVRRKRLVTLTGSGGAGKTRLSLQVAAGLLDSFANGVWFVELAPLADPALVPQEVAGVLGLQKMTGSSYQDLLVNYLREKQLLLILDNCEHVLDPCARLVEFLLSRCPQLSLLPTSREALGLRGETIFRVPSLDAPDPSSVGPPQLAQSESVRLFRDRASTILPSFQLSEAALPAVAWICHRLDGIPLAIELAAARVSVLSVEQIAARLDDRFRLLTGGSRTALPRQRTLRASIDWSYGLLPELERLLLQRLSVFSGGWTLEAAVQVCTFDGLEEWDILDGLAAHVNKSLIVIENSDGHDIHYHMLETIRQFAQEKLGEAGQEAEVRDRHLNYYLTLGEEYDPRLRTPRVIELLEGLDLELDNLRAAITWAMQKGSPSGATQAARILIALQYFWFTRALAPEVTAWVEMALPLLAAEDHQTMRMRARLLYLAGFLHTVFLLNEVKAKAWLEESIRLFRQVGSPLDLAQALAVNYLVVTLLLIVDATLENVAAYDLEEGRSSGEESLSIAKPFLTSGDAGERWAAANAFLWFGWAAAVDNRLDGSKDALHRANQVFMDQGDWLGEVNAMPPMTSLVLPVEEWQENRTGWEKRVPRAEQLKSKFSLGWLIHHLAVAYEHLGDYEKMVTYYQQASQLFRETGYHHGENYTTLGKGWGMLFLGKPDQALVYYKEGLRLAVEWNEPVAILDSLRGIAEAANRCQQAQEAVKLLGFLFCECEKYSAIKNALKPQDFQSAWEEAQSHVDEETFHALWQQGCEMTAEQAVEAAFGITVQEDCGSRSESQSS